MHAEKSIRLRNLFSSTVSKTDLLGQQSCKFPLWVTVSSKEVPMRLGAEMP